VVAPTTLLTALLYYFGWLSTNRFSRTFGIDPTTLGFSTQDYLLRAIGPAFPPLVFLACFGLLFVWIHRQVSEWIHFARHAKVLRTIIRISVIMGFALVFIGGAGLAGHPLFWKDALVVGPLVFGVGIFWAAYGLYLRTEIRQRASRDGHNASGATWVPAAHLALVYSLIVLSVFWAFGDAAEANGAKRAIRVAENLSSLPGVDVYSKQDLDLGTGTVKRDEISNPNSLYRFRYSGLKILVHSAGKYFLVPHNWPDSTRPVAIILPDDGSLRFEFTPPGFP
jgi:amino acid permease